MLRLAGRRKFPAMDEASMKIMRHALRLARRGMGKTSPNPAVGCVIVKDGAIVGEGWHKKAGTPHAEVHALAQAGTRACGADVYVTLEPCSHHGRTPPCAEALIEAGVASVQIGMRDPNPLVSGRGMERLRSAGIQVRCGILENECSRINEPFIKHVTSGMPFVVLKSAMTLDGKTATATGESKWITNDKSRRYVHKLRSMLDAVMVGVGTVLADDPRLTCRLAGRNRNPVRIIVDSRLRTPLDSNVLSRDLPGTTIIATIEENPALISKYEERGAQVMVCSEREGRVALEDMLQRLGSLGIQSLLLEGGSSLASSALHAGLIDKFLLFYAPKFLGGEDGFGLFAGKGVDRMECAVKLKNISARHFGDDIMLEAYPEKPCLPA
jgi:diaminohydroxyphosphoribosylaminopyrimidine deaminase/5-amino-6-(5-phosphoribosylamino)uracil reductase